MVVLAGACLPAAGSGARRAAALTIFAAASLAQPLTELAARYEAERLGSLVLSFDASSTLRTQLEQGAPADVLLSADETNARALAEAGLTLAPPAAFAGNALTIVVPRQGSGTIRDWRDLARPGTRIVAAGTDVPITRYAEVVIERLAAQPTAPADFAAAVRRNVVSREDNVRAVLAKVEIGEGDAAIVYVTDARSSDSVTALALPDSANVVARYYAVIMRDGPAERAAASHFVAWLRDPGAQGVLQRYGFLPLG